MKAKVADPFHCFSSLRRQYGIAPASRWDAASFKLGAPTAGEKPVCCFPTILSPFSPLLPLSQRGFSWHPDTPPTL
jgi:hypothetical protein